MSDGISEVKSIQEIDIVSFKDKKKHSFDVLIKTIVLTVILYSIAGAGLLLYLGTYSVDSETSILFSQFLNLIAVSIIPIFFGGMGSIIKLLASNISIYENFKAIIFSCLFSFSAFIALKSKIVMSGILALYNKDNIVGAADANLDIFSFAVVSIFVGIFASNIFLFLKKHVDLLSKRKSSK